MLFSMEILMRKMKYYDLIAGQGTPEKADINLISLPILACLCYNALYDFVTISFIEQLFDGGIK